MSIPELLKRTRQPLDLTRLPQEAERALPGEGSFIDFEMEPQVIEFWCWAAVAASVSRHYLASSTWTRCRVANAVLGLGQCCANQHSPSCNQMAPLENALSKTGNLVPNGVMNGPAPPAQVHNQINAGRVVGCGIRWIDGSGGHFVVVHGISRDSNGIVWVAVADPRYGPSQHPYNTFVNSYRSKGMWRRSYATEP
jgi:hypothetical protein